MTRTDPPLQPAKPGGNPRLRRVLRRPLVRMPATPQIIFLALALSFALTQALLPKHARNAWPILAALRARSVAATLLLRRAQPQGKLMRHLQRAI